MQYKVGGFAALPLGKETLSIPFLEMFTWECALLCYFSSLCRLTEYSVVSAALSPNLTMGMSIMGSCVSLSLFSLGHQCRSTEVRTQDCSIGASGPTMVFMEAAQILAWSNPHLYVPLKPTAAQVRPILGARALVPSYIQPALNI